MSSTAITETSPSELALALENSHLTDETQEIVSATSAIYMAKLQELRAGINQLLLKIKAMDQALQVLEDLYRENFEVLRVEGKGNARVREVDLALENDLPRRAKRVNDLVNLANKRAKTDGST